MTNRESSYDNPNRAIPLRQQPNALFLYRYQTDSWLPVQPATLSAGQAFPDLRILTWNVDFASHFVSERLQAALDYIESCLKPAGSTSSIVPAIIMLQEIHIFAFPALLKHAFVREHYDITDINSENFTSQYGTVSLIPKPLTSFVASVHRLRFRSRMGRDALILDLDFPRNASSDVPGQPNTVRIRLANTHLESLLSGTAFRPEQLKTISDLLHAVDGGLVAGDMNSIAETDLNLPEQLDLKDGWKVLKATALPEDGHTWGYQPRCRYPLNRMDKILFTGVLRPTSIERIGIGLSIEILGKAYWVSDHYGLLATLVVE